MPFLRRRYLRLTMLNARRIESILFFVADIHAAAAWYAALFASHVEYENPLYAFVRTPFTTFGFHPADAKCPGGAGGTVTYLEIENFNNSIALLTSHGATLHRGPMTTSLGSRVAMFRDPFGSLLGFIETAPKRAEIAAQTNQPS
jgi:uncharacterized protein